jgi:hypothetical protein
MYPMTPGFQTNQRYPMTLRFQKFHYFHSDLMFLMNHFVHWFQRNLYYHSYLMNQTHQEDP